MLRHRDDRSSSGSRCRAHSAQDRFVIGDVFNHVKRAGEIEDVDAGYVTRIHLHELHFRRKAFSRVGQPGRVQFGPHQTFPGARPGDGGKHRAIAAADFKKTMGIREVFADKADDELVANDKPEILAPGVRVVAARSIPRGAVRQEGLIMARSGTSMATPHLTGLVAAMFEAAGRPVSIAEIRECLKQSADAVTNADSPNCCAWGRVNMAEAIRRIRELNSVATPQPQTDSQTDSPLPWFVTTEAEDSDPASGTDGTSGRKYEASPEQEQEAIASRDAAQKNFKRPIVTEIVPATTFWRAEEYHQQYLEKRGLSHCHI